MTRMGADQRSSAPSAQGVNYRRKNDVDVLRVLFRDVPIEESSAEKPGVIFDYDTTGQVVGIKRMEP